MHNKQQKILIVSATHKEMDIVSEISAPNTELEIDKLVTGIGTAFTIFHLQNQLLKKKYDLILNIGICGSFQCRFPIGITGIVTEDCFADLAIQEENKLTDMFEMGYINHNLFPFSEGKLKNEYHKNYPTLASLPTFNAITCNTVHGEKTMIKLFERKYHADIETMEGAGFFYVCSELKQACVQIRSISNYVEPRNEKNWNISLALNNLGLVVNSFLKEFGSKQESL